MNLEQLNWLQDEGRRRLQFPTAAWQHMLPWQAALLDEQAKLRHRSRERFPDPMRWIWTDRSLQQASDWQCATFKSQLIPAGMPVVDACCGAGADLIALAEHHPTTGMDRDESMLSLARSNAQAHRLSAQYIQAELPGGVGDLSETYLHIDPDRRQGAGRETRTTHGEAFSPTLSECLALGERTLGCIIKLAPATAIDCPDHWTRCWLGTARHCPQQLLLRGRLTRDFPAGSVSAALVGPDPQLFTAQVSNYCQRSSEPGQYVYDLHPALYAAGLAAAFATEHHLTALINPASYFTNAQALTNPWVQAYRVLAEMSWDERRVRKWLRERSAGIVEVKTRHVSLNANQLQVKLSNRENPAGTSFTLLLYGAGKSVRLVIAQRLGGEPAADALPSSS